MIPDARPTARRRGHPARLAWLLTLTLALAAGSPVLVIDVRAQGPTETFEQTVALGRAGLLDLSNLAGRISITADGGDAVVITAIKRVQNPASDAEARALLSRVSIDVTARAGRVVIRTRYADRSGPRRTGGVSVDYQVRVPVDAALELRSVSGDIDVRDVRGEARVESVSGDIRVSNTADLAVAKTVSGDVELALVTAAGDATLASVSGDVRVRGLRSPRVEIGSVSGDLDLVDVQADRVEVGTVSGDVRFQGRLARAGRYEFHSHSGRLRLTLAGAGFDLEARSFSGDIDNRVGIQETPDASRSRRRRRNQLRGTVDDGGAVVDVRTFSGDIVLERE